MERAGVEQETRQDAHAIQQPHEGHHRRGQPRRLQQQAGDGVRIVDHLHPAVFIDGCLQLRMHVKERIPGVKMWLDGGLQQFVRARLLQHRHGNADAVARVELFVGDKAVQFRKLRNGADIARHDQIQVGNHMSLVPLLADIAGERVAIHLQRHIDHGVVAFGHQIRRQPHDGINVGKPPPVRTKTEHDHPSFLF